MPRGLLAVLVIGLTLVPAGPAAAATPQRILRDLADNGRLDHAYSRADIARALRYEQPARTAPVPKPAAPRPPAPAPLSVESARGPLPFTGLDLALFGGVGAPLLLAGASMRRLARSRAGA